MAWTASATLAAWRYRVRGDDSFWRRFRQVDQRPLDLLMPRVGILFRLASAVIPDQAIPFDAQCGRHAD